MVYSCFEKHQALEAQDKIIREQGLKVKFVELGKRRRWVPDPLRDSLIIIGLLVLIFSFIIRGF